MAWCRRFSEQPRWAAANVNFATLLRPIFHALARIVFFWGTGLGLRTCWVFLIFGSFGLGSISCRFFYLGWCRDFPRAFISRRFGAKFDPGSCFSKIFDLVFLILYYSVTLFFWTILGFYFEVFPHSLQLLCTNLLWDSSFTFWLWICLRFSVSVPLKGLRCLF